jgi:hypothetical protein
MNDRKVGFNSISRTPNTQTPSLDLFLLCICVRTMIMKEKIDKNSTYATYETVKQLDASNVKV